VRLQLVRERLVARLPLRTGARWSSASERIVLPEIALLTAPQVTIHETGPLWGSNVHEDTPGWFDPGETEYCYYAFHNASSHELVRARFGAGPRNIPPLAGGLRVLHFAASVAWPTSARWREPSAQLAWLDGAELVKIEATVVAEGDRTVELHDLRLPAMPASSR
jgi:hypothetical protein